MMWWFEDVFIHRNNPEKITYTPEYDEAVQLKENTIMLKIKLLFTSLKDRYGDYIDLRETRRALKSLDDHLLQDIGLERADWQFLMSGRTVKTKQVLDRLPRRRTTVQTAKPQITVLPKALPGLNQDIISNPGNAINDCKACAA